MLTIQTFKGCAAGWQPANPAALPLAPEAAARRLALYQRIKGQDWLFRLAPAAQGVAL